MITALDEARTLMRQAADLVERADHLMKLDHPRGTLDELIPDSPGVTMSIRRLIDAWVELADELRGELADDPYLASPATPAADGTADG